MLGIWLSALTPKVWSKPYPQFHFKVIIFLPDIFRWEAVFHLFSWIMQTTKLSYKGGKHFMFKGSTGVTYCHWKLSHWKTVTKICDVTSVWWKARRMEIKTHLWRGKGLNADYVKATESTGRLVLKLGLQVTSVHSLTYLSLTWRHDVW